MMLKFSERKKIRSKFGSQKSSSSKACSSKTAFKGVIVLVAVFVLIYIHLLNIVVSNKEEVKRHISHSVGIDESLKKHKSNLIQHMSKQIIKEDSESSNSFRKQSIHEDSDVSGKDKMMPIFDDGLSPKQEDKPKSSNMNIEKGHKDLFDRPVEKLDPKGTVSVPKYPYPALIGASKGKVQCDVDVSSLVYWNDPQGIRDVHTIPHFLGKKSEVSLCQSVFLFFSENDFF